MSLETFFAAADVIVPVVPPLHELAQELGGGPPRRKTRELHVDGPDLKCTSRLVCGATIDRKPF